jgi:S1-C subfamily serine protease
MPRPLLTLIAALTCAISLQSQTPPVHVKIHAVLVDKDLNQKPVPFLAVTFHDSNDSPESHAKTGLDGTAQIELAPGHYTLFTDKPIELGGKRYFWNFEVDVKGSEHSIDLTNDNARIESDQPKTTPMITAAPPGDLTALFDKLKNTIFTVHSEIGEGSGFLVDSSGLVVTNHHVVGSSSYLALQFDKKRKVPAKLLAENSDKDIAILWVNPEAFPEAVVAPLVPTNGAHVGVGQRVFTIGNPFGREKVLTTGVISKVEKDAIVSDITINPGNSGGPLFTLDGQAAGITRAGLRTLAYIVPIEEARPLIEQAKKSMAGGAVPSKEWLPVEPADRFPADALKTLMSGQKMDTKPYFFDVAEFEVAIYTPPLNYFLRHDAEMNAARKSAKRNGSDPSEAKLPESALSEAQEYDSVIRVRVRPKYSYFIKVKFRNGFQKMILRCNGTPVQPINPGRHEFELYARGKAVDTTFQGVYEYPPDAFSPSCGNMALDIFSEKDPNTPITKILEPGLIQHVWNDFDPYRKAQAAAAK